MLISPSRERTVVPSLRKGWRKRLLFTARLSPLPQDVTLDSPQKVQAWRRGKEGRLKASPHCWTKLSVSPGVYRRPLGGVLKVSPTSTLSPALPLMGTGGGTPPGGRGGRRVCSCGDGTADRDPVPMGLCRRTAWTETRGFSMKQGEGPGPDLRARGRRCHPWGQGLGPEVSAFEKLDTGHWGARGTGGWWPVRKLVAQVEWTGFAQGVTGSHRKGPQGE